MKRLLAASVLVSATLFAIQLHAAANEIRIISGALQQGLHGTGTLNILGTSGLRIAATLNFNFGSFGWHGCENVPICLPGDVVSLRADYAVQPSIFMGSGQVTTRGRTYSLFDEATAQFHFDGAFVAPEFTDDQTVQVSAPFAFSGALQVPNRQDPNIYDVFNLRGSGVATVTLIRSIYTPSWWIVGGVTYDFVPRSNMIQG